MKSYKTLILLCLMLLRIVSGADYYVASDGNNGNGGTDPDTDAWLTITYAVSQVAAGDTITVTGNTFESPTLYAEYLSPWAGASGTSGNEIILQANPARSASFYGIRFNDDEHIIIRDMYFIYSGVNNFFQNIALHHNSNIEVDNCYFTVYTRQFCISAEGTAPQPPFENVYIHDCLFEDTLAGISIWSNNGRVEDNEIDTLIDTDGVSPAGTADYCRFFGDNMVLKGNYWHGTNMATMPGDQHIDGFQTFINAGNPGPTDPNFSGETNNIQILNNRIFDGDQGTLSRDVPAETDGDRLSKYQSNYIFNGNVVGRMTSYAMSFNNISGYVIVENNTIYDYGLNGIAPDMCENVFIHNNIIINGANPAGGLVWENSVSLTESDNYAADWTNSNDFFDDVGVGSPDASDIVDKTGDVSDLLFTDWPNDDFSLTTGSPAIDVGLTITLLVSPDIAGTTRPQNSIFEMGAYEFDPSAAPPPTAGGYRGRYSNGSRNYRTRYN